MLDNSNANTGEPEENNKNQFLSESVEIDFKTSYAKSIDDFDLDFEDENTFAAADDDSYLTFTDDEPVLSALEAAEKAEKAAEKEMLVEHLTRDLNLILNPNAGSLDQDQAVQKLVLLLRQTEKHVLQSLALYLCELKDVPPRIIKYLTQSSFQVAKPVLEKSPCVDEELLMEVINAKSADYWRVIATRLDLTDNLVDSLAACKDAVTSENLLDNQGIELTDKAFEYCSVLAREHQHLADKLSKHPDIPHHVALQVYWQVSHSLREELSQRHKISKEHLSAAFKSALADFNDTIRGASDPNPTPLMWELARKYKRLNKITPATLAKTLHDGRTRFFIALFSEYTNLSYMTIYNAMKQPGGRMFTIICKAYGFSKEYFVSLFLKARSLVHSEKVVDSEELHRAIKLFDSLEREKAYEIVAS